MKFEFETSSGLQTITNSSLETILNQIEKLNGETCKFCILEDMVSGNYVQCFGDQHFQCIEYHKVNGEQYQHFLLGEIQPEEMKPWYKKFLDRLAPVGKEALDHEWHTLQQTKQVFTYFYQHQSIPSTLQCRDITRFIK